MAESEKELNNPLMKVKGEWKTWHDTKTMAFGPITSCQIDGEKMETVTEFIFFGSKITADDDSSQDIKKKKKKTLAPWKKSYDKPWKHVKNRAITLLTKVHIVKALVFLVVMYICECWTIKKAEHQRIDAFKVWC